jgi:DNA-binding MarR family transcriptional regulator
LEGRKLIERVEDSGDRRALVLRLTAKGRKLFDELLPLVLGFEKDLISRLPPQERKGLLKGLDALERKLLPRDGS